MNLRNLSVLTRKEIRSVLGDIVLIILMVYFFTGAVYTSARGAATDVRNASVAVIDHDRSELTASIVSAILPPRFKKPEYITDADADWLLDMARFVFIIDFPSDFEKNLSEGKKPEIAVIVDATAMTHASAGTGYLSRIIEQEIHRYLRKIHLESETEHDAGVSVVIRNRFNPNASSIWHMGVTQIIGNLSLLTLILAGAAVIRERERGTIEHLLVMPVSSSEIAFSKIIANVLVILCFALGSLFLVVNGALDIPLQGSVPLFAFGTACYIFCFAALGIMLATLAPHMPQFGLLCIPVYIVLYLLSGAMTPLDNMPQMLQEYIQISPTVQYSLFTHQVIFRNAGLDIVGKNLFYIIGVGSCFIVVALLRFRSMLSRQG
jgi:ABC-2 type transport system permease protein